MPNVDLLEIAKDKTGYTGLANTVAFEELKRRKVSPEEIAKYEPWVRKINAITRENCLVDLEFFKKLLYFYVLWFPGLWPYYSHSFIKNGYILKSDQSNYYRVLGFIAIVVTILITNRIHYNSLVAFLAIWIALFLLSYLFDIYFNRKRQMGNIQKAIDSGEIPWGF